MLRTLIFAGMAAVAGRQLYRSGVLDTVGATLREQAAGLKRHVEERLNERRPVPALAGSRRATRR